MLWRPLLREAFFMSATAWGSREALRSLKTKQHVRSGAGLGFRSVPTLDASRFRNRFSFTRNRECCERTVQYPVTQPAPVYGAGASVTLRLDREPLRIRASRMTRKSFTESLILAQDERWRRA